MPSLTVKELHDDLFADVLGRGRGGGRRPVATLMVTNPSGSITPSFFPPEALGRSFTFRVVRQGDRYGQERSLTREHPEPLIEVFASDRAGAPGFDELGQLIPNARYELADLRQHKTGLGLTLHSDDAWTLHPDAMRQVKAWLWEL